jgi:hypothetical protein
MTGVSAAAMASPFFGEVPLGMPQPSMTTAKRCQQETPCMNGSRFTKDSFLVYFHHFESTNRQRRNSRKRGKFGQEVLRESPSKTRAIEVGERGKGGA